MNIRMRRLTLAAAALSTVVAPIAFSQDTSFVGDQQADYSRPWGSEDLADPATRAFVGSDDLADPATRAFVGSEDLAEPSTRAFVGSDDFAKGAVRPASNRYIGDEIRPTMGTLPSGDYPSPYAEAMPMEQLAPVPMATYGDISAYETGYREAAPYSVYGGQCDSFASAIASCNQDYWMRAELLLWFPEARTTPPMGVSADAGQLPLLGSPTAMPLGESYGNNLVAGFRGDVGRYFADGLFGIGGRVWVLGSDDDSLHMGGDGSDRSFGVPFFNTNPDRVGEDAILVGFDNGAGTRFVGDAAITNELNIVAAELYGRLLHGSSKRHRFEFLGGYSHFNIHDQFSLDLNTVELPRGERTIFRDRFDARNEFHGGQIGSELSLTRGRWLASALTKVHLGNMNQRLAVEGFSSQEVIGGGAPVISDQGLFARGDVRGVQERDTFAFAPEMNLRLGYQFRKHVSLHVGYSFIYWSDVALTTDQIDRNVFIDQGNLGNSGPDKYTTLKSDGLWVQGIDLGATLTF